MQQPVAISSSLGRRIPDSTSSRFTYVSADAPNGRATLARVTPPQLVEALIARILEPHAVKLARIDSDRPLPVERGRSGTPVRTVTLRGRLPQ